MCTSPLVRYRLKRNIQSVPSQFRNLFSLGVFDIKRKGFQLRSKNKMQSLFKSHTFYLSFMDSFCDYIEIPCGKCFECKKTYAKDWAVRCYHESLYHYKNCFLTLTIDNCAHEKFIEGIEKGVKNGKNKFCNRCNNGSRYFRYPVDYSLNKGLILDWLKKCRDYLYRRYGISIRYFGVGEYGSQTERPHYHILIFGYDFGSVYENGRLKYLTYDAMFSDKGKMMRVSNELRQLWLYGYSYVQDLNINSCLYVAKYCMKKVKFLNEELEYDFYYGRVPEFLFMSRGNCQANRCKYIDNIIDDRNLNSLRSFYNKYCKSCTKTRGGLGYQWICDNWQDVLKLKYIVIEGKKYPIPKYYKNLINLTDDKFYDLLTNEIIYYVNSKKESDPDYNSSERCKTRREINRRKNILYNTQSSTV